MTTTSDLTYKNKCTLFHTLEQHFLNGNFHQVESPGPGASVHHLEVGYTPEIFNISCSFSL